MKIDNNTTLFIDRDGVINDESKKHYVTSIAEFQFLPAVLDAFQVFSKLFNRIIIVTNQRVVGKGIISENELQQIHHFMVQQIEIKGGRVDAIYYCTHIADDAACRKPNTGMALQAKQDFPEIDFTNSIMIGNAISDMEFGKKMNMQTYFVRSNKTQPAIPHILIDKYFNNILAVAEYLQLQ
jgi:D-glycero-D-manno-heptose 1,7-bisphosphate phosphatase